MDKVKLLQALKDIKDAFLSSEKFKDAKLADGTIIRYDGDALLENAPVMAVTDAGVLPLPDGDYSLEDGTTFSVAGGIVIKLTPAEEKPADPNAPPTPQAGDMAEKATAAAKAVVESIIKETRFAEQISELKSEIEGFKTVKESFATQKTESEKVISELNTKYEKLKTAFESSCALLEKLAEMPSADPAEGDKKTFNISEYKKAYKADLDKIKQD